MNRTIILIAFLLYVTKGMTGPIMLGAPGAETVVNLVNRSRHTSKSPAVRSVFSNSSVTWDASTGTRIRVE